MLRNDKLIHQFVLCTPKLTLSAVSLGLKQLNECELHSINVCESEPGGRKKKILPSSLKRPINRQWRGGWGWMGSWEGKCATSSYPSSHFLTCIEHVWENKNPLSRESRPRKVRCREILFQTSGPWTFSSPLANEVPHLHFHRNAVRKIKKFLNNAWGLWPEETKMLSSWALHTLSSFTRLHLCPQQGGVVFFSACVCIVQ